MYKEIKCKNCRSQILTNNENLYIDAHNKTAQPLNADQDECKTLTDGCNIFLNEDCLPQWMNEKIEQEQWSKGRINCKQCDSRIGGFDFVSGLKCDCNYNTLPPVHIIRSKVDAIKNFL